MTLHKVEQVLNLPFQRFKRLFGFTTVCKALLQIVNDLRNLSALHGLHAFNFLFSSFLLKLSLQVIELCNQIGLRGLSHDGIDQGRI